MDAPVPHSDRSLGQLFTSLSDDAKQLFKAELRLAKLETSESVARAGRGSLWLVVAFGVVVVALVAFTLFLATLSGRVAKRTSLGGRDGRGRSGAGARCMVRGAGTPGAGARAVFAAGDARGTANGQTVRINAASCDARDPAYNRRSRNRGRRSSRRAPLTVCAILSPDRARRPRTTRTRDWPPRCRPGGRRDGQHRTRRGARDPRDARRARSPRDRTVRPLP